jgi:predicted NUDIX family NTP pyrophosphohydrolase
LHFFGDVIGETSVELGYSFRVSNAKLSAGLLMVRRRENEGEVLLVHPGGPYFRNKDEGAWTVPKGLVDGGEELLDAAKREFVEETSFELEAASFVPLGEVRMKSGKRVHAWAFAGDCDPSALKSNDFEVEWPPRSGKMQAFPEVDRAGFFDRKTALSKIIEAQRPLVDRALCEETLKELFGGEEDAGT